MPQFYISKSVKKTAIISSLLVILLGFTLLTRKRVVSSPADVQLSSIYFLQTTESPVFDHRADCSVESAALYNPDRKVIITFVRWKNSIGPGASQLSFIKELQSHYPNVLFEISNVHDILVPVIENWYEEQLDIKSKFAPIHLSDALRLSIVYSKGGVYLDTDIISTGKLNESEEFISSEDDNALCNSAFQFGRESSLLMKALIQLPTSYDPNCWACIGPQLIDQSYHNSEIKPKVLEQNKFAALGFGIDRLVLAGKSYGELSKFFTNSYGLHLFNNHFTRCSARSNGFLRRLYRQHCPHTYRLMRAEPL